MKELSIEEKAKRYDEAIEKFDVILNLNTVKKSGTIFADDVRKILPELKESDDERMIQYFKDLAPFDKADELYEKYGFSHKDAISWLEKQGEHAKFRDSIQVGDKVTRNQDGVLVNLSQLKRVAKPSDDIDTEKQGEQNPAWSEEDEAIIDYLLQLINNSHKEPCTKGLIAFGAEAWLKSLKDRVQPKQKRNEEDEKFINGLIRGLSAMRDIHGHTTFSSDCIDITETINWLKSLRPQSTWKPSKEMLEALYKAIPENVMEMSEDEMLLDKLYQGLKYGKVLSEK